MKFIALFFLVGLLIQVNGDSATAVKATVGSSAKISCNITGRASTTVEWLRHQVGTQRVSIWNSNGVAAAYSSLYSVSVSSNSVDLTVTSVQQSDFNFVFRCRDNATNAELQVAYLSSSDSSCATGATGPFTISNVKKGASASVDCNINNVGSANISWYYLIYQKASQIWYNNSFTQASFSNYVTITTSGTKSTLTILNVTTSYSVYCFDQSSSPYATDLGYFTVCSGNMISSSLLWALSFAFAIMMM